MEAACIQLRKMLELVAFASLVANKDVYAKVQADFAKHWNAQLLLKDLERVNPHFYPAPMVQERSDRPDVKWHVRDVGDGFMTREEFVEVYKKCGRLLHAANPFGNQPSYAFYRKHIPLWQARLRALLAIHAVKLVGQSNVWMVHMQEHDHDRVTAYTLTPTEG